MSAGKIRVLLALSALALSGTALAQVTQSREQVLFYTQAWQGERYVDGRPKLPDGLIQRALDCTTITE